MKQQVFNNEFNKLWKWYANDKTEPNLLNFKLDFYKKLWNFFLAGDTYYYILNHYNFNCDFISADVERVMGYAPAEFSFSLVNEITHPEDLSWFLSLGKVIMDFFSKLPVEKLMKYKVRYDYRLRKKNGDYVRILYQGILMEHDNNGRFLRTLNIHTDITYLKKEGKPVLSFVGLDEEPSYIDVDLKNHFSESKDFTTREKQILTLLVNGKLSKEISSILNISKQTVDTHRKNMLHKKGINNTNELVAKAITQGWV